MTAEVQAGRRSVPISSSDRVLIPAQTLAAGKKAGPFRARRFTMTLGNSNVRMRVKYLGTHAVSSTVICCQLLDPRWKLEVEAMAAT